jgi:hypothetical protein
MNRKSALCGGRFFSGKMEAGPVKYKRRLGEPWMEWSPEAEARLKEIPFFVRPAARKKIEKFAQEQNVDQITEAVYEAAKKQFG